MTKLIDDNVDGICDLEVLDILIYELKLFLSENEIKKVQDGLTIFDNELKEKLLLLITENKISLHAQDILHIILTNNM